MASSVFLDPHENEFDGEYQGSCYTALCMWERDEDDYDVRHVRVIADRLKAAQSSARKIVPAFNEPYGSAGLGMASTGRGGQLRAGGGWERGGRDGMDVLVDDMVKKLHISRSAARERVRVMAAARRALESEAV